MTSTNGLIIIMIVLVVFIIWYAIKYYNISNTTMREKFAVFGWNQPITLQKYYDMANSTFLANSPIGQTVINSKVDTISNIPVELEKRKALAMINMNDCYNVGVPNDKLNANQMNCGALLVLP